MLFFCCSENSSLNFLNVARQALTQKCDSAGAWRARVSLRSRRASLRSLSDFFGFLSGRESVVPSGNSSLNFLNVARQALTQKCDSAGAWRARVSLRSRRASLRSLSDFFGFLSGRESVVPSGNSSLNFLNVARQALTQKCDSAGAWRARVSLRSRRASLRSLSDFFGF